MKRRGALLRPHFVLRQSNISRKERYTLSEGTDELWAKREEEMKKDGRSTLHGLSRPSVTASASKRFPKLLTPPSSLSLRDISILASFDDSENAVGIRWKVHPSIFFWFGVKRKGGLFEVSESIRRPHNVANDEGGGIGCRWRKAKTYRYNFHIFLSCSYIYMYLRLLFCRSLKICGKKQRTLHLWRSIVIGEEIIFWTRPI